MILLFSSKSQQKIKKTVSFFVVNTIPNSTSCSLYCKAVCNIKIFSKSKNPRFIIKSSFKSRAGYNGARTVFKSTYLGRPWCRWREKLQSSSFFFSKLFYKRLDLSIARSDSKWRKFENMIPDRVTGLQCTYQTIYIAILSVSHLTITVHFSN